MRRCWEEGYWADVIVDGKVIKRQDAIKNLDENTELGEMLLKQTLAGYEYIYESFSSLPW